MEEANNAAINFKRSTYPQQLDYFSYNAPKIETYTPVTHKYKSGGKTPTYLKRHTGQKPDEAIWINRNREVAKALEKIHDAVIKLFMKANS